MRRGILTDQQRAVLTLVAQGKSNNEIAEALTVSLRTVHAHIRNILDALHAPNRTAAVVLALYHGEIAFAAALGELLASPEPIDAPGELSYDEAG